MLLKILSILVLFSIINIAFASDNLQGCIPEDQYNPQVDYFPVHANIQNSTLFNVTYFKSYKVVTTTKNKQYVLYQCGSPIPDATQFANGTKFFSVPAKSSAIKSTTPLSYMLLMGLQNKINYTGSVKLISSPCIQSAVANGTIQELSSNKTIYAQQIGSVDVVFQGDWDTSLNNSVVSYESTDPGPLHRAGWINFFGLFFNAETVANSVFAGISSNYHCFSNASQYTLKERVDTLKLVAWTSYDAPSQYNQNTASWSISNAAYKTKLTIDAGAYILNQSLFTQNVSQFLEAIKDVDVIIDETYQLNTFNDFLAAYGVSNSTLKFKFVTEKTVFRQDGLENPFDGRDWFESAIAYDDAVLQDLIRAVYPVVLPENTQHLWFRNLAIGEQTEILSASNCTNPSDKVQIYKDRVIKCSSMPLNINSSSTLIPSTLFITLLLFIASILF